MNYLFFILIAFFGETIGLPLENPESDLSAYFLPRIVGGIEAPEDYAPYMVALLVGEDFVILYCGGSLVTPRLVLTAAHCIDIVVSDYLWKYFHAKVGTNNWNKGGELAEFSGFDIHPDYNKQDIKYDVGFLMLKDKVMLNERVATIALEYDWVGEEECFVTGWGRLGGWTIMIPFKLHLLYVNTITPQECSDGIRRAEEHWGLTFKLQHDVEICTFHSLDHGMCNGDSGSALVQASTRRQVGIASWAFTCALGFPDIFVRLSGVKNYTETIINRYK